MKTFPFADETGSPATGSRQMLTSFRPMSSSAHPVTPIAPAPPVLLSTGVSISPDGAVGDALIVSCTGSVIGEFATPGPVIVSVPPRTDPFGYVPGFTVTLNRADPFPDAGVTVSHVASELTDHGPDPFVKV